jgi:hypothetical protein
MTPLDLFRQFSLLVALPAVLLAAAGMVLILVPRDWRLVLVGYALVCVMLTILLVKLVPAEWALLQAFVGGLVAVMCYISARQLGGTGAIGIDPEVRWPQVASLTGFRVMTVALAAVAFFVLRQRVPQVPRVDTLYRDALLWLTMMGLLGLALYEEPLHAGLALLAMLAGSELLLFSLIQQRMWIGLLLAGQLLLGLAISYLMVSRGLSAGRADPAEDPEPEWQA